jgi:sugar phosphate isomerase/epimerase
MCNETFVDWPQAKIFRFLKDCGYQGVEIAPFTINTDVTKISDRQRAELRDAADKAGISICALHWLLAKTEGLHLTHPDPAVRKRTAAYLGELGRFCHDLGGQVMVFGSPKQRNLLPGVNRDQAMEFATDSLRRAMESLEEYEVTLALEPLSPRTTTFMATAAQAVELIDQVDSTRCKLLLDCLAMSTESSAPAELIRKHARHLVHLHANDPNRQGPGMGDLDFRPIFDALKEIRFGGWISVEVFDYSPGAERIAKESLACMQRLSRG